MNDMLTTLFVSIGILSFIGCISVASAAGWYFGKTTERNLVRSNYRLVSKQAWPVGDSGLVVNLAQKRLIVMPGETHPEMVTIAFPDNTVVLKPSAVAEAGVLSEESVL